MSTTRHLINRQRRLAAAPPARDRAATRPRPSTPDAVEPVVVDDPVDDPVEDPVADQPVADELVEPVRAPGRTGPWRTRPGRATVLTAALALLTVLLGGLAAFSASRASALHDPVATGNAALTDTARTSEVKGAVTQAVNAVFSYDYADTARTDSAAERVLTGRAVQQYATMLAQVRAQAPAQKLVLTTTVTDTGVESLTADRARVLVFADQRNTATARSATPASTTYAAAMFAVDAVRQDGTWKIAAIDTFG
jgi:Mce-associated membrane protein